MNVDIEDDEPETLPEEIVHWQPTHRPAALAIGRLKVKNARFGRLAVDELVVGRFRVRERD